MEKKGNARNQRTFTNTRYPGINLKFLLDFFDYLGVTANDYKQVGQTTPQALRMQLRSDDMKISKATTIINDYGYDLKIKLSPKEEDTKGKTTDDGSYAVSLPPPLEPPASPQRYQLERIAFLEEILTKNRLSNREFARKLGVTGGSIQAWLKTDDMMISHVNKIKDAMNMKVEFIITKKDKSK